MDLDNECKTKKYLIHSKGEQFSVEGAVFEVVHGNLKITDFDSCCEPYDVALFKEWDCIIEVKDK